MVNESRNASGATPAAFGRTQHAEPNSASSNITLAEAGVEQDIQYSDFESSEKDSEEDERAKDNDSVELSAEAEERSVHVGHSINPRGVATRVVNERDEEEDRGQDVNPGERPR